MVVSSVSSSSHRVYVLPEPMPVPELWLHIFSFLSKKDVGTARLVCRGWKQIIDGDNALWRIFFKQDFPAHSLQGTASVMQQYQSTYRIEQNWESGHFHRYRIDTGLKDGSQLVLHEDWLISAGADKAFHAWDKNDRSKARTFKRYSASKNFAPANFKKLEVQGNVLILTLEKTLPPSSYSEAIIWDKQTGRLMGKALFDRHLEVVADGDRFYSCMDNCIHIWDMQQGIVNKIHPQKYVMDPLVIDGDLLLYRLLEGGLEVRDKCTGIPLLNLEQKPDDYVSSFFSAGDYLIVAYEANNGEGYIQVRHKKDGSLATELLMLHQLKADINKLKIEGNYLFVRYFFYTPVGSKPMDALALVDTRDWSIFATENNVVDAFLNDGRIILTKEKGTILIRDAGNYSLLATIDTGIGPTFKENFIGKIVVDKTRLFAELYYYESDKECAIKVWNKLTGALVASFEGEKNLFLDGSRLITSRKGQIIIRDYS